jgi:hypothetical protein
LLVLYFTETKSISNKEKDSILMDATSIIQKYFLHMEVWVAAKTLKPRQTDRHSELISELAVVVLAQV